MALLLYNVISRAKRREAVEDDEDEEQAKWDLFIPQGPAALPSDDVQREGEETSESDDDADLWGALRIHPKPARTSSRNTSLRKSVRRGIAETVVKPAAAIGGVVADVATTVADTVAYGVSAPARAVSRRSGRWQDTETQQDTAALGSSPSVRSRKSWREKFGSGSSRVSGMSGDGHHSSVFHDQSSSQGQEGSSQVKDSTAGTIPPPTVGDHEGSPFVAEASVTLTEQPSTAEYSGGETLAVEKGAVGEGGVGGTAAVGSAVGGEGGVGKGVVNAGEDAGGLHAAAAGEDGEKVDGRERRRRRRARVHRHASDIALAPFQSIHSVAKASLMRLQQLLHDQHDQQPLTTSPTKLPPRQSASAPPSSKLLNVPEESPVSDTVQASMSDIQASKPSTSSTVAPIGVGVGGERVGSRTSGSRIEATISLPAKLWPTEGQSTSGQGEEEHEEEDLIGRVAETRRLDVRSNMGTLFVNQYVVIQNLGSGTFGKVKLALNLFDEELYAIKLVNKGRAKRRNLGHVRQARDATMLSQLGALSEVEVLRNLDHPNLVKLYEVIDDPNSEKLLMVMEYVEGGAIMTLEASWSVVQPLPEDSCRIYFREALKALLYLHANMVVHGDIKPDNLLLSADGNIKIADFGSSRLLAGTGTLQRTIGTPAYLAPEIVAGQPYHGRQADIWALGVTLYALLTGRMPFTGRSFADLYDAILAANYTWPEDVHVSQSARDLVDAILHKQPEERLTLLGMGEHAWTTVDGKLPPPQDEQTDENMYQPVAPPPSSQTTTAPMSDNLPQPTPSVFANVTPPHTLEHSFSNSIAQHSDRDVSETERAQSTALPPHNFLTSSTAAHQASSQASGSSNTVVVPGDLARSFIEQHDDPQGLLLYDEARNRSLARWEKHRRKMRGQLEPYFDYQDYPMGAWVVRQGDTIQAMYMIRDGQVELWHDHRMAEGLRVNDSDLDEEEITSEEEDASSTASSSVAASPAPGTTPLQPTPITEQAGVTHPSDLPPGEGQGLPSKRSIMWQARVGTSTTSMTTVGNPREKEGSTGPLQGGPQGAPAAGQVSSPFQEPLTTILSMSAAEGDALAQGVVDGEEAEGGGQVQGGEAMGEDAVVTVRSAGEFLLGSGWGSNSTIDIKEWVLNKHDFSWEYGVRCKTPVSLLVFRRENMLRALQEKPHLQLALQAAVARSQSEALRASILDHLSLRKVKEQSFSKMVRKRTALQQSTFMSGSLHSGDGFWRTHTVESDDK